MTRLRMFLTLLGVGVLLLQIAYWLPIQVSRDEPIDSEIYHHAAQEAAAGRPVYGTWAPAQLDHPSREFIYPPTALLLLKPFAGVSLKSFNIDFYLLVIVAFWALAAALAKIAVGRLTVPVVLAAGAILQFVPGVFALMMIGNADIFVWALVAWAFAAPRAAGALLALATSIKIYPAVLVAVWCWRAPLRIGRQAAVVGASILVVTWLTLGLDIFREWFTVGLPALHDGLFWHGNWSLSAALVHPFVHDMTKPLPRVAATFLAVFPFTLVAVVAWTQRQRPVATCGAIVLTIAVWAAPVCWWWRLSVGLVLAATVCVRERKELICESL